MRGLNRWFCIRKTYKDLETRFFVALEFKSRQQILKSPDAILSIYNHQNKKLQDSQKELAKLKLSEAKLKQSNYGELTEFQLYFFCMI